MKEKPKLLITTDCFFPRKDGISIFLVELLPYLKKEFEITVIAPKYGVINKEIREDINLITFPLMKRKVGDYPPAKPKYMKIKEAVGEADVIWSQTIGPIGTTAIWAARSLNKPVVAYIHSIENELVVKSIGLKGAKKKNCKLYFKEIHKILL